MPSNAQIAELVKKGKESKDRKFAESMEAFLTFRDVDPKKNDLNINETVYLPHPGAHRATVCFVGSGDLLLRAKNAKVDGAIEPAQLESYAGNKKEAKSLAKQYDFFLADTALMPRIGRILGQYLGPRGKIPQPVPPNAPIEAMISRTRTAVRVRSRGSLGVGAKVGDKKLSDSDIAENVTAVIAAVQKKLPNGDKNIRTVSLKTSMGKLVKGKAEEN
ncbi:MAG: 50S ribosomal protein L1 [Nitrososphaerota archaeon]|jgi:large subunit ribosomal protein L1|nr:50S ribosomal protein L1 [Nitrososphaerota archaeon]MDG6966194.1 50S ribosomal protein L1 [Nitrososphaerota archaeon]MDG6968357.1 50S ribosomal protein L1 [Nitrososphaerota archaeon]MDG6977629.1 50S ribosomal protein L1 [Nitrososphaerota archaeon]MDG7005871.1 50S ribosomal protein L1 [Nitrososphaerota archaeon]